VPGCPACPTTLQVLNEWVRHPAPTLVARESADVVIIGIPDMEANKSLARELRDQGYELVPQLKMLTPSLNVGAQQFGVVAYPTVFVLDANNVVLARGRVNYRAHLESLFRRAFASEASSAVGSAATPGA
jgi:hypothetical protein